MTDKEDCVPDEEAHAMGLDAHSIEPLDHNLPLEEARDAVVKQNEELLSGELSFDIYRRRVAHNNYLLYERVREQENHDELINKWLAKRGFTKKEVKSSRKSVRFARAMWKGDSVDSRRISDEANVLETGYRYFSGALGEKSPDFARFSNWVDECGGFNEIRRNRAPEKFGGPQRDKDEDKASPADKFEKRLKAVRSRKSIATIDVVPLNAEPDQIVVFYGIAKGQKTSLRMACLLPSEGGLNVHNLKPAKLCHNGDVLVTDSIEGNITLAWDTNATTADDQIDQLAEMTS